MAFTKVTDNLLSSGVGTGAGNILELDSSGKLPAVDGSLLTNLPAGGVDGIVSTANANTTRMQISNEGPIGIINDTGAGVAFAATGGASAGALQLSYSGAQPTLWIKSPSGAGSETAIMFSRSSSATVGKITTSPLGTTYNTGNGGGIDFSGNSNASGMSSELLDDYEEGTWTPTQGTGLSVSGSFSSSGVYTKIGRLVVIEGVVTGSTSVSVPSINSITIRNMPFAPSYSRSQGIAGNQEITGGSVGFQAPNTDIYFSETMGATTNIRFAITFITS